MPHNMMSKVSEKLRAFNEWLYKQKCLYQQIWLYKRERETFASKPSTHLRVTNGVPLSVPDASILKSDVMITPDTRDNSTDLDRIPDRVARNIDWYLEAYPGLDAEEKQAVDELVAGRTEYHSKIQDARTMNDLLYDARMLTDAKRDSETVRYAFVADYIRASFIPKCLSIALARFQRRLPGDAEVVASYNEYQARVDELSLLRPAIDHFEAVTGHVIRESESEYILGMEHRLKFWKKPRKGIGGLRGKIADRHATPGRHERVVKAAMSLANTFAIVSVVIIVLYSMNYANQSPTERMAHIRTSDLSWVDVGLSNRGLLMDWELKAFEQYDRAVHIVARSRKSVFGLFRSYRSEDLYLARRILENTQKDRRIAQRQMPEALLLLAKLNFLLGDLDKAIPALRDASYQDGPAAEEAHKFLHSFGPQNK